MSDLLCVVLADGKPLRVYVAPLSVPLVCPGCVTLPGKQSRGPEQGDLMLQDLMPGHVYSLKPVELRAQEEGMGNMAVSE